jgi:hypothetical protein
VIELKSRFKKIEKEIKRIEQILNHDEDTSEYWNNIQRLLNERKQIIAAAKKNNIELFD